MIDAAIFERHLDLTPLGGRSRGLVHCRLGHTDETPSLSLDLARGLFHCFSCGQSGGTRRFAELVGEAPRYQPPQGRPVSDYEMAVHQVLRREREAAARRAEWLPYALANDHIRACRNAVAEARRWAELLGPDHARTWKVLERAALVETEATVLESQLDAILEEGRIG